MSKSKLRNIGPRSAQWLADIGIHTVEDLERVGVEEAYFLIKAKGYNVSAVLLYALYGALHNLRWQDIPLETRTQLRQKVDGWRWQVRN
jgi:DNA transformation protein and related proteins